jgi:hypothetical protein
MRNLILIMTALSMIMFAVACDEGTADRCADAASEVVDSNSTKLTEEEKKYGCYVGCLEVGVSKKDCKEVCYSEDTSDAGAVDSSTDATITDAVSIPGDVTPQG